MMMEQALLKIADLTVSVRNKKEDVPIVKGIDLVIPKGGVVGLVGESGCGKSMTAKAVNRLLPVSARVTGGEILWYGDGSSAQDLVKLPERALRHICGREIGMVFQEPMTSLNPLMRVGDQVGEVLLLHRLVKTKEEAKAILKAMPKHFSILEDRRVIQPSQKETAIWPNPVRDPGVYPKKALLKLENITPQEWAALPYRENTKNLERKIHRRQKRSRESKTCHAPRKQEELCNEIQILKTGITL